MRRNWNLGKGHLVSQALPKASEQPADPVVGGRSPPETLCPHPGTAAEPKACTDMLAEPRLGSMTVKVCKTQDEDPPSTAGFCKPLGPMLTFSWAGDGTAIALWFRKDWGAGAPLYPVRGSE